MGSVWRHLPLLGSLLLRPGAARLDTQDRHTAARTEPDPRLLAQFEANIDLTLLNLEIQTKWQHRSFAIIVRF
jgi:hypothetical protein